MPSNDREILSAAWESPDDRSRFLHDCIEPGGVAEYSHAGFPAFRVGGRKFASLALVAARQKLLKLFQILFRSFYLPFSCGDVASNQRIVSLSEERSHELLCR